MSDRPTVLVTGGAGYIGSHVCKGLANKGYLPVAVDNLSSGHKDAVKWGPLAQLDIRETEALKAVFEEFAPQAVMHFAGSIEVGESMVDPLKYYRDNVGASLSLLQAMEQAGCSKLIFSSTAAVFGQPEYTPIDEEHPLQPMNPYGASKKMVEQVLTDLHRTGAVTSVSLRYFNAAGADEANETGERHDPETHLVPLVLQTLTGQREVLRIFGTDYPTADGTCVRDYIHVTDLAEAHLLALDYLLSGGTTLALNLGTGHGYSVQEVIEAVESTIGRAVPVEAAERRNGDPAVLVASPALAERSLGWRCERSLEDIISSAWRWHTR